MVPPTFIACFVLTAGDLIFLAQHRNDGSFTGGGPLPAVVEIFSLVLCASWPSFETMVPLLVEDVSMTAAGESSAWRSAPRANVAGGFNEREPPRGKTHQSTLVGPNPTIAPQFFHNGSLLTCSSTGALWEPVRADAVLGEPAARVTKINSTRCGLYASSLFSALNGDPFADHLAAFP